MRLLVILACLVAALAPSALAQTTDDDATHLTACLVRQDLSAVDGSACIGVVGQFCLASMSDAGASSNGGQMSCYEREAAAWRAVAASAAAQLRQHASPSTAALLDRYMAEAETWARARCGFEGSHYEGGSFARVIRAHCARNVHADQALYLYWRAYQAPEDGNAWPPGP